MRHGSLFSGIGGFDLAAEWMGWENVFHCEWEEFPRKVLEHYWPKAISYGDIKKTDFTIHRGNIDLISGGFPCQPYSQAGKRKGKDDERHLWPEMCRAIREIQPSWIVGENVFGLINWNGGMVFDEVQTDLEAEGYEVWAYVLPACAVNAPHRRDRVWFVAHNKNDRQKPRLKQREKNGIRERGLHEHKREGRDEIRPERERPLETQFTPNPNNPRTDERVRGIGNREEKNEERRQPQPEFRQVSGDAWDTESKRSGEERKVQKRENTHPDRICGAIQSPNAPNTKRIRSPLQEHRQEKSRLNTQENTGGWWADFPTQSPICSRDDGISTELDGITFPKWRNESIKAYGNAVVPQVVYQIFKSIAEYEKQNY